MESAGGGSAGTPSVGILELAVICEGDRSSERRQAGEGLVDFGESQDMPFDLGLHFGFFLKKRVNKSLGFLGESFGTGGRLCSSSRLQGANKSQWCREIVHRDLKPSNWFLDYGWW